MVFAEPGPRLGRERLRNGRIQCEPMRDENPCAARISTVSSTWHEPLMLTTDQEVGDSSSSGRAAETPAVAGAIGCQSLFDVLTFGSHSYARQCAPRLRVDRDPGHVEESAYGLADDLAGGGVVRLCPGIDCARSSGTFLTGTTLSGPEPIGGRPRRRVFRTFTS